MTRFAAVHRRLARGAAAVALFSAACAHPRMAPQPATATAPEVAIYRTIAESVYVRSTGRSVGIVTAVLTRACAATEAECPPLEARWGLDPLWWATGDSSAARATRADLLARASRPTPSLEDVSQGQRLLQAVAPDSAAIVIAQPDTAHWQAFKANHGGLSGFIRFSPIGFDAARRSAIVFVDWRCGPLCGHQVAVALAATPDGAWRIADMLLLKAPARPATGGMP